MRYKRLTTKKIFVGRGDLKHTSSKVIITFYVYDTNISYITSTYNLIRKALFFPIKKDIGKKVFIGKDRLFYTFRRKLKLSEFINLQKSSKEASDYKGEESLDLDYYFKNLDLRNEYLSCLDKNNLSLTRMMEMKLITEDEKNQAFMGICEEFLSFGPKMNKYENKAEKYYLINFLRFRFLLGFNQIKYSKTFIFKLIKLVENIYTKKVEFNIVKLRNIHLNTDIYTQAVALKLKNRNNSLYKVLKISLSKFKVPYMRKVDRILYKKRKLSPFKTTVLKSKINFLLSKQKTKDPLNKLLLDFYRKPSQIRLIGKRKDSDNNSTSLTYYLLKTLKHINLIGFRVEAKGRITRRFTASRSVFKVVFKGGLINIDSTYKGKPATMLRGHLNSNVDYTFTKSKRRTGSYGVKG